MTIEVSKESKPSKLSWMLLGIQIIIAVSTLLVTSYFTNENLRIMQQSKRADLSVFVSKAHCYLSVRSNFTFEISIEIRNEGSRSTIIKSLEIWLIWKPYSWATTRVLDSPSDFGWENLTIAEEQTKHFLLRYAVPYNPTSEASGLRVVPDEGFIQLQHYDGKGDQQQIEEFTITNSL